MGRILSQAEIDALLTSVPSGDDTPAPETAEFGPVVSYDFRRPDRVSKDQIRSLYLLHDRFARNLTSSLAAYLRTSVEASVAAVEQFSYSEFLMSLPDPTAFYSVRIKNFDGLGALELNPSIAFTVVDRMLGGMAQGAIPDRALTEIEQTVVDSVVKLILEHLTETWRSVTDMQFAIEGRETRPQMLPIAGRNEIMILLGFDVKVAESRGMLHVCIPAVAIESIGLSFSQGWQQTVPEPTPAQRTQLVHTLGRVPMPVTAMLESSVHTRDVLNLHRGDVLNLGIPIESPVKVRIGSLVKCAGHLVADENRAGIRVNAGGAVRGTEVGGLS